MRDKRNPITCKNPNLRNVSNLNIIFHYYQILNKKYAPKQEKLGKRNKQKTDSL